MLVGVAQGSLKRAEAEIAAGRVWRAKEILRGALSSSAEPALLERYGRLLDELGDRYEAGKYLFLSGARPPEYADAIDLFLMRTARRSGADFVQLFPASVRRLAFQDLPPVLHEALRQRGVGKEHFTVEAPRPVWSRRDLPVVAGSVVMGALLLVALVIGARVIVAWVWNLF